MSIDGLVDTETASRLLGVSSRRVNQLVASGEIARAARGLYDRLSIESYLASRHGTVDRAWAAGTAWAAVAVLSGRRADWLSERSTYRLEATLRTLTAAELVGKTRDRARVQVYAAHSAAVRLVRADVVAPDWGVVGLAGETDDRVDGYLATDELTSVVDRYALVASSSGTVTLRVTDLDVGTVRSLVDAGDVLVALDAAGSTGARARGAGERALDGALARFRDGR